MKKFLLLTYQVIILSTYQLNAQNIGIGTETPNANALLHVDLGTSTTKGFLVTGIANYASSTFPSLGEGSRLMFYPGKGAFRAGVVGGTQWDNVNVGRYSIAMGVNTIANNDYSTAFGYQTTASGFASTTMGAGTNASGGYATAMGYQTTANLGSTSMGYQTTADGIYSTAMGYNTNASDSFSTAMGNNTYASGRYSTAMGYRTNSSGIYSIAMGSNTIASANNSAAMGYGTTASGLNSIAMGYQTTASGLNSTAMGYGTTASGLNSTTMGYQTTASGIASTAIGNTTTASGNYSVAMGYNVSTNSHAGAFFFGDSDPNNKGVRTIGANDQFAARFNGGYYFITSNSGSDIGVQVLPGQNSWSVISDINRKENFLPVDGEAFLDKISTLNLTTWNYKGQDKETFRHYGPMAQDFNAAFGKDDLGTIGCDTLINQQDFLGVNLIAIQALEKRTEKLTGENNDLKEEIKTLKSSIDKLSGRLEKLEKIINK